MNSSLLHCFFIVIISFLTILPVAFGQIKDSTKAESEEDYSQYGSVEESVKYCTQKVRFLSPTKLVSLGYEWQAPFSISILDGNKAPIHTLEARVPKQTIRFLGGARWAANAPVISKSKFILNLGASYYESYISYQSEISNDYGNPVFSSLSKGLRTMGLNATAFKPFDEKHFLILSVLGDCNGNFGWDNASKALPTPTWTFAALYGWKKSDTYNIAIGATQTWRGGEKLYLPILLLNKTFNDKWGIEMLLPARVHVRYNFSPQSLLLAGFESEGNSYQIYNPEGFATGAGPTSNLELRRSELKFRMIYERKLIGFIWLSAQVGYRYNYKFNFSDSRSSKSGDFVWKTTLGNPLYAGLSINLVSP